MAKVFVDTNYFIGIANRAPEVDSKILDQYQGYISALSCHILFYVNKIKVPNTQMNSFIEDFNIVYLEEKILAKAFVGPTDDLEDNIQLHSAIEAECDFFLTADKRLLKMKFFGKAKIVSKLSA